MSSVQSHGTGESRLTCTQTLFSTDVVKYQGAEVENFSSAAMIRWTQVTLPLTFLTMLIAWWGMKQAGRQVGQNGGDLWAKIARLFRQIGVGQVALPLPVISPNRNGRL